MKGQSPITRQGFLSSRASWASGCCCQDLISRWASLPCKHSSIAPSFDENPPSSVLLLISSASSASFLLLLLLLSHTHSLTSILSRRLRWQSLITLLKNQIKQHHYQHRPLLRANSSTPRQSHPVPLCRASPGPSLSTPPFETLAIQYFKRLLLWPLTTISHHLIATKHLQIHLSALKEIWSTSIPIHRRI